MKIRIPNISDVDQIIKLSKLSKKALRRIMDERSYSGKGLTKNMLIYQIVFKIDA